MSSLKPSEIPEVRDFLTAERALELFKEEHHATFEEWEALVEDRNQKRQAADQAVRSRDVSCGPWDRYQEAVTYDIDKLYNSVGREEFLKLGGKISTQTVYEFDKATLEMAIKTKKISEAVAKDIKKVSPRYHSPKDL